MRRLVCRHAALACVLALAACAPVPHRPGNAGLLAQQQAREQALAHADHWVIQGRLGVSDGTHGGSGSFSWSQQGDRYAFELRAPITGKSFRLIGSPDGAELDGVASEPVRGPDAEALMRQTLGWDVPLRDLRAWVLGLRADSGPAQLDFGPDGLPATLAQDGWTVDYRSWNTTRQPPLPDKVFAARGTYRVRLSIDSWQGP